MGEVKRDVSDLYLMPYEARLSAGGGLEESQGESMGVSPSLLPGYSTNLR